MARDGHFNIRGSYDRAKGVNVLKEGYQFLRQSIAIDGDTTVELQLVRR
jgi:hypothetical protein